MNPFSSKTIAQYNTITPVLNDGQESFFRVGFDSVILVSGGVAGLPQIGSQDPPLSVVYPIESDIPVKKVEQKEHSRLVLLSGIDERTTTESEIINIAQFSEVWVQIEIASRLNVPVDGKCVLLFSNDLLSWKADCEIPFVTSYGIKGTMMGFSSLNFRYLKIKWIPSNFSDLGNSGTKLTISLCARPE